MVSEGEQPVLRALVKYKEKYGQDGKLFSQRLALVKFTLTNYSL